MFHLYIVLALLLMPMLVDMISTGPVGNLAVLHGRQTSGDRPPIFDVTYKIRAGGGANEDFMSFRRDLILGKDRELLYFSVDLKWMFGRLTDKHTYVSILRGAWKFLSRLWGGFAGTKDSKDAAVDILQYIRSVNPDSPVKLFQSSSLQRAEWLALATERLLLVYIEDGDTRLPTPDSIHYRRALSDQSLGHLINEQVHEKSVFSYCNLWVAIFLLCSVISHQ
jgi:hypothetical protein